jgi:Flp pilus assembly pilin Flp
VRNPIIARAIQAATARSQGQGLVEYGLILILVAIAAIAALVVLGAAINGQYGAIAGVL